MGVQFSFTVYVLQVQEYWIRLMEENLGVLIQGPKHQGSGPKYHSDYSSWVLKPHYLSPRTLGVWMVQDFFHQQPINP